MNKMSHFSAGRWAIGLLIYFFCLYIIILFTVLCTDYFEIDKGTIYASDPGFQNELNTINATPYCSGSSYAFCGSMEVGQTECEYVTGCSWSSGVCTGIINLYAFGGRCSSEMNETFCRLIGCKWNDYNSQRSDSTDADISSLKKALGIMTGFYVDIGIPPEYVWITSFFMFWIEFIAFLWVLYTIVF